MSQAFTGEIRILPYTFPPRDWAYCAGQTLLINQYSALYAVIRTTYGGDGRINFKLPNLQGSVPIGFGSGPGLTPWPINASGGVTTVTLNQTGLPQHTHSIYAAAIVSKTGVPTNTQFISTDSNDPRFLKDLSKASFVAMSPAMLASAGGSQPHSNMQPYLGINFCICLNGVFPNRS